jgi:TonB-dependent receptor
MAACVESSSLRAAIRRALYPGASALALGALGAVGAMPVTGQEASDSSVPPLQEVVVTGIRKSLESAQAIKQNSEQIVDSVTSQDIGALPDRSVSEALQRIPGITLQRTDNNRDPARLASEGGGVFIRGLSWVRSELNGRDIFSANDGRAVSFEDVSADLLSGIDVYKNPAADQVEGGVGGIVNLRTRLPFDSAKQQIAFSGDYNYADLLKKGFFSGNALYSNQWETDIGRIGGLVSASLGNIGNRTDSIQLGRFVPETLATAESGLPAGATVYLPNSMGWRRIDWQQRRTAVAAALQWQPSDAWLFTAQAFQAKANPHDLEYADGDYGSYLGNTFAVPANFNSSGVLTSGTLPITPQLDTRFEQQHHSTTDFSLTAKFQATARLQFTGDVQYIKSHADITSLTAFTQVGDSSGNAIPDTNLNFNLSGNNPYMLLTQSPNVLTNPANYWWAAAMDHLEDNDAHSWAERLDGDYKFEDNEWLDSFRFGIRATDKTAITRETGYNWAILSHQYWGGGAPLFLNNSTPAFASQLVSFNDFFRGKVQLPGAGYFPSYQLVRNGTAYAYSILQAAENPGSGWMPLTTDWSKATPGADNPVSGINNQQEHTYAAYGLLRFAHEHTWLGRMDGNIGVRVVRTQERAATGTLNINPLQNALSPADCIAANGAAACQYLVDATAFSAGGNQSYTFPANNYTDVLPTANIRFLLTKDLQLRFAAGKAMVRPSFTQMLPYTNVGFSFLGNTGYQPALVSSVAGTGGNPQLKPTRANQFDGSLEWYFAPTGSLTFDVFYKDIHDYIFGGPDNETLTSNGVTETFQVTRYQNGSKGQIRGFEASYQQFFDFLPGPLRGLGFQGNITLVDSSGGRNPVVNVLDTNQTTGAADQTLPLEGMSRWSYNANLMYERSIISARLAWNWRERYLLTTSAANINAPVWSENYGQLDSEVFFTISSHFKVGVQATNLLNSRTYLDVGGAVLAPRYSWTDTDRRYALAVRAQF